MLDLTARFAKDVIAVASRSRLIPGLICGFLALFGVGLMVVSGLKIGLHTNAVESQVLGGQSKACLQTSASARLVECGESFLLEGHK